MRRSPRKPNHVTIVADNPQTVDQLDSYFKQTGVTSTGTRNLTNISMMPPAATALVLFPDDFQLSDVAAAVALLRRLRPEVLIVLVTGAPQNFGSLLDQDRRSLPLLVLPKPVFGWTILDAIRGCADLALP